MSSPEPMDRHPLDPDPPRPPGVPDLDLDIPKPSAEERQPDDADGTETTGTPEPPD